MVRVESTLNSALFHLSYFAVLLQYSLVHWHILIYCLGHCVLLHCYTNGVMSLLSKHLKQLNSHVNHNVYYLDANLIQGSLNNRHSQIYYDARNYSFDKQLSLIGWSKSATSFLKAQNTVITNVNNRSRISGNNKMLSNILAVAFSHIVFKSTACNFFCY